MNHIPLLCDNESDIKIAYNHCEHSRTKHIDILHHFLRDHAIKGDIVISHVGTNDQLANIFTKSLDEKCGLVYYTSDLKLVMPEKKYFYVKNPIYAKNYSCSMIRMVSSHIYVLIFITCPCTTNIYICTYIGPTPKSNVYRIFGQFLNLLETAEAVCTRHVWPFARTYSASGPDMSGSRVSALYKGA
jgi:hypothetical protein